MSLFIQRLFETPIKRWKKEMCDKTMGEERLDPKKK